MPDMPTCETCRHWTTAESGRLWGACTLAGKDARIPTDDAGDRGLTTRRDFGCVGHERRVGAE